MCCEGYKNEAPHSALVYEEFSAIQACWLPLDTAKERAGEVVRMHLPSCF